MARTASETPAVEAEAAPRGVLTTNDEVAPTQPPQAPGIDVELPSGAILTTYVSADEVVA